MTLDEWKKTETYHKAMTVCLRGTPAEIEVALQFAFVAGGLDGVDRVEARLRERAILK